MELLDQIARAGWERAGTVRIAHDACLTSGLHVAAGVSAWQTGGLPLSGQSL